MALQLTSAIILFFCFFTATMATYNVLRFGATPDGHTDSAPAFLDAWNEACSDKEPATLMVPDGDFLVSRALFEGPCNNGDLQVLIKGNIVRNSGYCNASEWIAFKNVEGLTISGGTFDAHGQSLWACKAAGHRCPTGSTALTIDQSKNVVLSGIMVKNSEKFHISIMYSRGIRVEGATITAPFNSPNTDGIHIHTTSGASVINSSMGTGDDCISLGTGAINIWIENIRCGPGHGISIGSLGEKPSRSVVENVTVSSVVLTGTKNGLRIKTWANPYDGFKFC